MVQHSKCCMITVSGKTLYGFAGVEGAHERVYLHSCRVLTSVRLLYGINIKLKD